MKSLVFKAEDCCGDRPSCTVDLGDRAFGVTRIEDNLYNVTLYRGGGLLRRELGLTLDGVQALIAKEPA